MDDREKQVQAETEGQTQAASEKDLLPLDFPTFILSLSTSALINLGVFENPVTKTMEKEPQIAKQTIDLIDLLRQKTKNNLTEEEERLMDNVLHELRLLYCKVV